LRIESLIKRITMFTPDLQHTIKAFIRRGETHYVAECLEVTVVTQGKTLDETIANLQEAVVLRLEGEDPALHVISLKMN
jgi:predicted RNase H-like HicB family nuclease